MLPTNVRLDTKHPSDTVKISSELDFAAVQQNHRHNVRIGVASEKQCIIFV